MYQSVLHILLETIKTYPHKTALMFKENGQYKTLNYTTFGEKIRDLTAGLYAIGLKQGDRIAILSYNRPEWTICDFAIFALRGIVVPLYHTLPPDQIAYILNDAKVKAIFVENEEQLGKIQQIHSNCNSLKYIFTFIQNISNKEEIITFNDLIQLGKKKNQAEPDFFNKQVNAIHPDDICSLVYTSGTTGDPKGVMLHHKGFVHDIINSEKVIQLRADDIFLSFLPLSHLYERLAGHWCAMYKGCTIAYAESIETVVENIQEIQPTVLISVPRLYEKIYQGILDKVEEAPAIRKKLFNLALKNSIKYHEQRRKNRLKWLTQLTYKIVDKLVFSKIREQLGGHLRYPISGGAPLAVETCKFFEAIGLPLIEGYGMTESHLIITLAPLGKSKYGSCGKPIPGIKVKIAEDGEILVHGDTVMAGYYNKPEATKEAIDENGWLHTGDIGFLDEDNYLFITDRKKNIIVTAGGKNIAPAPIENALKQSKYIEDVCLIGDRRKFLSALIIPNFENLKEWALNNGIPVEETSWLKNDKINNIISTEIEKYQIGFARYEKVKKFIILSQPLTIEDGSLTPSLKIKRKVVEKRFKNLIDQLYQD